MGRNWTSSIVRGDYLEIRKSHLIDGKKDKARKAGVDVVLEFGDNRWREGRTIAQVVKVSKNQIRVKQVTYGGWEPIERSDSKAFELIHLENIEEWAAEKGVREPKKQKPPVGTHQMSKEEMQEALSRVKEKNAEANRKVLQKAREREKERLRREEEMRRRRFERLAEAGDGSGDESEQSDKSVEGRSNVSKILDNKNDLLNGSL